MKTKYTHGGNHVALLPQPASLQQLNATRAKLASALGTSPAHTVAACPLDSYQHGVCTLYRIGAPPAPTRRSSPSRAAMRLLA